MGIALQNVLKKVECDIDLFKFGLKLLYDHEHLVIQDLKFAMDCILNTEDVDDFRQFNNSRFPDASTGEQRQTKIVSPSTREP